MTQNYGVQGARGEAQDGFPHVINIALPTLYKARKRGIPEDLARFSTEKGWYEFQKLDKELIARNASPGGSADLLAATLFLDSLSTIIIKPVPLFARSV